MTNDERLLQIYLKEIASIPMLSREEETELALKAKAGDKLAREKIVRANLRFVVTVAKKYINNGIDFMDLISEGNVGLLIAIDHFEPSRNIHFVSYAVWWIRQAILKSICEKSRAIRLPLNKANDLVTIQKTRKLIGSVKNEEEEIAGIAKQLGLEKKFVREMLNLAKDTVSLDASVETDENGRATVADTIEDDRGNSPENHAIELSMKDDIDKALDTLKPNEARVLRMRYGLNGLKPMSLKEVGEKCNLTRERIRQIEKTAINHLRLPQRSRALESYVA
ncbi:MAG: RNA polymerase sigma factor RpoD/SigA [Treponema sp.]|nr:RNA polymerase sigma factor RpoD/SigA [Treponema sp.]